MWAMRPSDAALLQGEVEQRSPEHCCYCQGNHVWAYTASRCRQLAMRRGERALRWYQAAMQLKREIE